MAKKSIIDIEVNDEKWQEFIKLFEKYEQSVDALPDAWQKMWATMGGGSEALKESVQKSFESLSASGKKIREMADGLKLATVAQKDFSSASGVSHSRMKTLVNDSNHLGKSLLGVAGTLLKLGAGFAIGGLFGMFGLGESAAKREHGARGLGLTTGQVSSFDTHMKYVAPANMLSNTADVKNDITKWWTLTSLGLPMKQELKKNPMEMSFDILNQARNLWKHGPQTLQYAQARGLTSLGFSLEDLRRLTNTSGSVLMKDEADTRRDVGKMGFSHQTGQAYQNFMIELKKAGTVIESVLIKGLQPLLPALEKTASVLMNDFIKFIGSPETQKAIRNLGGTINEFASFLGSKGFRKDLTDLGTAFKDVTAAILWAASKINSLSLNDKARSGLGYFLNNSPIDFMVDQAKGLYHFEKKGLSAWWNMDQPQENTRKSRPRVNHAPKVKITAPPGFHAERSLNAIAP